jgi:hypothetical protein
MFFSKNDKMGLAIATLLFALIAIGQFWRALSQTPVVLADHSVPIWPSLIAGTVAAIMAIWLGRMLQRHNASPLG